MGPSKPAFSSLLRLPYATTLESLLGFRGCGHQRWARRGPSSWLLSSFGHRYPSRRVSAWIFPGFQKLPSPRPEEALASHAPPLTWFWPSPGFPSDPFPHLWELSLFNST